MPTYAVSVQDVVTVTEDNPSGQSKYTDELSVVETFTGQSQLTSQVISVVETFGEPVVTYTETLVVGETFYSSFKAVVITDAFELTETIDISTSVLQNPETTSDTIVLVESFGTSQNIFTPTVRETLTLYETFFAMHRVDYMTQHQYYYTPRQ